MESPRRTSIGIWKGTLTGWREPSGKACIVRQLSAARTSPKALPKARRLRQTSPTGAAAETAQGTSPRRRLRQHALAECLLRRARTLLPGKSPKARWPVCSTVTHQLESRMREIRQSGSEVGGGVSLSLPLSNLPAFPRVAPATAGRGGVQRIREAHRLRKAPR